MINNQKTWEEITAALIAMQAERDALAATVVTLRTAINENCFGPCNEPDGNVGIDGYPWAFRVLSETEDFAFCLAAHDAEVAAKAVEDALQAWSQCSDSNLRANLKHYAHHLRAKAKS